MHKVFGSLETPINRKFCMVTWVTQEMLYNGDAIDCS